MFRVGDVGIDPFYRPYRRPATRFEDSSPLGKAVTVGALLVFLLFVIYLMFFKKEKFTSDKVNQITYYSKPGCPYCMKFEPEWQKLKNSKIFKGTVFEKKGVQEGRQIGITSYPTIVFEYINKNGQHSSFPLVGYMKYEDLIKKIKKSMK